MCPKSGVDCITIAWHELHTHFIFTITGYPAHLKFHVNIIIE